MTDDELHEMILDRGAIIAAEQGLPIDLANDVAFCIVCKELGLGQKEPEWYRDSR